MRSQAAATPTPTGRPAPLSTEDQAILDELELLEQLELLETWDASEELTGPAADEGDVR